MNIQAFCHANKLSKFFIENMSKDPFIIDFYENNIEDLYRIPMFSFLLNSFLDKSDDIIKTEEIKILTNKLKISLEVIKEIFNDKKSILMPFGLDIKDEKNIETITELLKYHGKNEFVRYFSYIASILLPKLMGFDKIYGEMEKEIQEESSAKNDIKSYIASEITNLFLGINKEQKFEQLILLYTHSYDNIMSFFFRPIGQEGYEKIDYQKNVISKVKKRIPKRFDLLFGNIDYRLRNALVHRNYYIDESTNELVYYVWNNKKKKYIYKKTKYTDFSEMVYDVLTTSISFFGSLIWQITSWFSKTFNESLQILFLWQTDVNDDFISKLNDLLGFQIDTFVEFGRTAEEGNSLISMLLEIRGLITLTKGTYNTKDEIKKTNIEFIEDFWDKLSNQDEDLKKEHEKIYSYGLYCISHKKSDYLIEYIYSYLDFLRNNDIELSQQQVIFEAVMSTRLQNREVCQNLIENHNLDSSLKQTINEKDKKFVSDEYLNMTYDQLSQIPLIYQDTIKKYSLHCARAEIEKLMKELNELLSITIVIKLLQKEKRPLTGSQLTLKIRSISGYEEWPNPEFTKVIKCLEKAENLKILNINKRSESDFIVNLNPEFEKNIYKKKSKM